jgi:hypothetical protein
VFACEPEKSSEPGVPAQTSGAKIEHDQAERAGAKEHLRRLRDSETSGALWNVHDNERIEIDATFGEIGWEETAVSLLYPRRGVAVRLRL